MKLAGSRRCPGCHGIGFNETGWVCPTCAGRKIVPLWEAPRSRGLRDFTWIIGLAAVALVLVLALVKYRT